MRYAPLMGSFRLLMVCAVVGITACSSGEPPFRPTGDGGSGGVIAVGGSGGSGGSASRAMEATPCGDPLPTTATCPSLCDGGCSEGTCYILCADKQSCNGPITCPSGLHCQVTCTGEASCRNEVRCDDDYNCHVTCNSVDACEGLDLTCGARSDCLISCLPEEDACQGVEVACGSGRCEASCFTEAKPELTCANDTCSCESCE